MTMALNPREKEGKAPSHFVIRPMLVSLRQNRHSGGHWETFYVGCIFPVDQKHAEGLSWPVNPPG